jgi:hypothetical protein
MDTTIGSVFVSHAMEDRVFAGRLIENLRKQVHGTMVSGSSFGSARPSQSLRERISSEFGSGGLVFLAVLSPDYCESEIAQEELTEASRRALRGQGRLIPLRRRPCDPAGLIGMLETADFTDDAAFEESLAGLIRGIVGERPYGLDPGRVRPDFSIGDIAKWVKKEAPPIADVPVVFGSIAPKKIFISSAAADRRFAANLRDRLRRELRGTVVFDSFFTSSSANAIVSEFRADDVFIAVISPDYLQASASQKEVDQASRLVLCGHGRLIPLMRGPCDPGGLISMLEVADFTDDAAFEESFACLMHGIIGGRPDGLNPGLIRGDLAVGEIARLAIENSASLAPDILL